jgi:N-acyl homoserine lactone hydrolase
VINVGQEQTKSSMNPIAEILTNEKATLWINHDKVQRETLRMSAEYYE